MRTPQILGLTLVALVVAAIVLAPVLTTVDPLALSSDRLLPPSTLHPMGTDDLGRDMLARVLYGGRVSLIIGLFSAIISVGLGMTLGLVAGYFGGLVDELVMRFTEMFQILPRLLVAIVVTTMLGNGVVNLILVIGLLTWPATTRIIRARVQVVGKSDFVVAAAMSGASPTRIIVRHIFPNIAAYFWVSASLQIASAVIAEAFLSFLGLGNPEQPGWGYLLQQGQLYIREAWWLTTFPGIALAITILGLNLAGDEPAALRASDFGKRTAPALQPGHAHSRQWPMLSIRDLVVEFAGKDRSRVPVVNHVNLDILPGEIVGIVGESGSGKSMLARSILQLVASGGRINGSVLLEGDELLDKSAAEMRAIRGAKVAMVFQDPMTSLNPVLRVGDQIGEAIRVHQRIDRSALHARVDMLLNKVGIIDANTRAAAYPHEYSGGMRQRALIAMGVANDPRLLIADEPTTALDVTVQSGILELLRSLNERAGTSILLITHNMAVVASLCQRVVVLYAGRIVETGSVAAVLSAPRHPYTYSLLQSVPLLETRVARLPAIDGQPPSPDALPTGCKFHPRCRFRIHRCIDVEPDLSPIEPGHQVRCWAPLRNQFERTA